MPSRDKTFTVGVFMPDHMNISEKILEGIRRYAVNKGNWQVVLNITTHLAKASVQQWRFDGAIFDGDKLWMNDLEPLKIPMVNISQYPSRTGAPQVIIDSEKVGRLAAEHFLARRYRHFGFVGYSDADWSRTREKVFHQSVAGPGRTFSVYRQPLERFPLARERRLERWLARLPKPAAVLVANDTLAFQTIPACHRVGLTVPGDVALLGVDNLGLVCELVRPTLSSVMYPGVEIGYRAAEVLQQQMQGRRRQGRVYLIPSQGIASRTSTDVFQYGDEDVAEAMRFIREHANEPITVQDILNAVPISRSRLERRFRSVLGTTPLREIQIAHISRAKMLLERSDLPLSTIADRCGCRYASHLSQLFKEVTGITPSAYRARHARPASTVNSPTAAE